MIFAMGDCRWSYSGPGEAMRAALLSLLQAVATNKKAPAIHRGFFKNNVARDSARAGDLFLRIDIDATTGLIEPHATVHESVDCVIATEADILARFKFRAALTDDDVAGDHLLAAEFFDAEPFADAVASVLDAALTFLMCHEWSEMRGED